MADYTSSNTGAVIDAAVDYVEILDNYLTISSNELIITGQTGVGSDTVLLNLKANNSAGFAGNVLRFTDTDPTAVNNGSMGKIQWFSTDTGAVVAEINGKNDDDSPDGQLIISTAAGASLTQRIDINADGDIQFFNAAGTSRDLHWDATDSRLGINVTTPSEALDVLGNANFTGTILANTLETSTASGGLVNIVRDDPTIGTNNSLGAIYWNSTEDSGTTVNPGAAILALADQNHSTIASGSRLSLQTTAVSATTPTERLRISAGGDISFYEDTGTTAKFFWDASAENLGLGTTTPDRAIKIEKDNAYVWIADAAGGNVGFIGGSGSNDGLMRLYEGTGHTAKVEINSNADSYFNGGKVGIGRTNPSSYVTDDSSLYVKGQIRVDGVTNTAAVPSLTLNDTNSGLFAPAANEIAISTGAAQRMLIDSSGNAHFGTAAGVVANSNLTLGVMSSGNSTSAYDDFRGIHINNENATAGSGLFGGGISFGRFGSTSDDTSAAIVPVQTTADEDKMGLAFFTHNTNTRANPLIEAMRLDASASLLVGRTSVGSTGAGHSIRGDDSAIFSRTSGEAIIANSDADGTIIEIRQSGGAVGSIGSLSSNAYIGTGDTGILFSEGADAVLPHNPSTNAARDAAIDLGYSSGGTERRFKDLYLSGRARAAGSTGLPAFASVTDTDTGMNPDGAGNIQFTTQGSEAARFDSSGNLLVGSTTLDQANNSNTANCGINLLESGIVSGSTNNATTAYFNRLAQDGEIVSFRKDGSTVGSIASTDGTDLQIGSGNCYLRFDDATNQILPTNAAGTKRNGVLDLGGADARYKDLHTSGRGFFNLYSASIADGNIMVSQGVYVGAANGDNQIRSSSAGAGSATLYIGNAAIQVSSDQRLKTNIVDTEMNATEKLNQVRVVDFNWDDPSDTSFNNRNARGKWTGVLAQELVDVLPFAVNAPRNEEDLTIDSESDQKWLVDQAQMVPVLIKAIQELTARIAALEGAN